jgi:hypothetical protein
VKLEEITIIKITPPSKKQRKEHDIWSLKKHPELASAIKLAMQTGKEQYVRSISEFTIYHIRPVYPLVPEAMDKPENKSMKKVSIGVYHAAFHLGAR